jgi:chromosome segregation ATPase
MIDVTSLTDGSINGDGVFDKLMTSVTAHVERQYSNSRITGADYANVYLGSLTTVLNQSSSFLLQSEQLNKQLLLLDEQIANVQANSELVAAQKAKMEADTALSVKQLEVLQAQIEQSNASTQLTNQQKTNAEAQYDLILKQQDKADKETALLEQKLTTEIAQTVGDETTVKGILGKQMELIQKQAEGFDRNSEQKLVKMMIDTWTVRQSTDGADTLNNGLSDDQINNVLNIAKTGIGAPTYNP